jgi:hypothetical protein
MSEPQQPPWVQAGRCDFCPREASLHEARCNCRRHTGGVHACRAKHLPMLGEAEIDCRACALDLPVAVQHRCPLAPTGTTRNADAEPPTFITCPQCGMTSHNPNDVAYRYCGNCHQFHDQMRPDITAL